MAKFEKFSCPWENMSELWKCNCNLTKPCLTNFVSHSLNMPGFLYQKFFVNDE